MTTVDDDFREFVAARWPELESVALVVLLDPERARSVTADALATMNRRWHDTLDAGRPGEQARAAVLRGALTAARDTSGADLTSWSTVPDEVPDEVPVDDPVVAGLGEAIRSAPPLERAVLAATVLWGCAPGDVAHLLDRDRDSITEHAASLDSRLTAAHDAARATAGLEPAPWGRERDVSAAVDEILQGLSDPPDPAALVADRAGGLRRRTLVTGGVAAAALAGVGAVLLRRGADQPPPTPRLSVAALAPDDPRWASVTLWTPRGPLAGDPAVTALVGRSADPRDRVLWAGDVGTQRVVLALTYTGSFEQAGESIEVIQEPMLSAYQGPEGTDPSLLSGVPLDRYRPIGTSAVVALTLPGRRADVTGRWGAGNEQQSLLIVLARPTLSTASVSVHATPQSDGTLQRTWSPLPLDSGINAMTLDVPTPIGTAVRVGSWEGLADTFTSPWSMIANGPNPTTSPEWALPPITAVTGIPADRLTTTVLIDEETPGSLFGRPLSSDATPSRLTSLLTTTPEGAVLRTTAHHGSGFVDVLEAAFLFAAGTERDPLITWLPEEREGVARFLVAAPGSDRVQLISTSPSGYPVSKVVRTEGKGAVVVPVVNGGDAGEYRVITKDAEGRVLFDGVPSQGRYLLDS